MSRAACATVLLTFNEPVALLSAVWTTPEGASLPIQARSDGERLVGRHGDAREILSFDKLV
jgi:hypothetical protein